MTTDQFQSIKSILTKLEEGKKLTLSFPSPKERELFRVALHKAKREVDEVFLVTDPNYEIESLSFIKEDSKLQDGMQMTYIVKFLATIQIIPKNDLSKRGYSFSIVGEENGDNQDEYANQSPGVIDPSP